MAILLDERSRSLALVDAGEAGWESTIERVTRLLVEFGAEGYLVEGPESHAGDERLWIGVYAVEKGTRERWARFVKARRAAYQDARETLPEVEGVLGLLKAADLRAEVDGCRSRLPTGDDPRLQAVVARLGSGGGLTETDWVLDVPEDAERDVIWLWAAGNVLDRLTGDKCARGQIETRGSDRTTN